MVKDVTKGGMIGAAVTLLSFISGCLIGALFSGSNAEGTGAMIGVFLMFGLWLIGPIVFFLAIFGTGTQIRIWSKSKETVALGITNTIALVPINSRELRATAHDILSLRMSDLYPQTDPTTVNGFLIVILVLLLAAGVIPGLIFWVAWSLQSRHAGSAHKTKRLTLELVQGPKMKSIPILNVIAKDVTSLRFDTPQAIEDVIREIKRRISIREVRD